jgi:site-specific recombinase XerD
MWNAQSHQIWQKSGPVAFNLESDMAAYIEQHPGSAPTIKQHLAAIKMLFDYLVISQIVPTNPAAPVKGPTHVVKRGKTPVLSVEDARALLNSIPTDTLQGLRDRALIGVMLFSFARVSAVLGMGRTASRRPLCTDLDPRSADAAFAGEGDAPVRQTAQLESGQNC